MKTRLYKFHIVLTFLYLVAVSPLSGQDTIRIMPLGNSITEGYTDGTLTEPYMRSYRYGLRYLLKNAGYKTDFVGSQSGGSAYFSDCQHAGIGGSRDQYVARLLTDGYDERWGVQIINPPGPYLDVYNPDIILLHIGTNDITHEGSAALPNEKISDILDLVDEYEARAGKEVIVFLALIINRVSGPLVATTTAFNNGIKSMALSRIASGDKIVIVDMEHDAGFEYSFEVDMAADGQGLHPNDEGYSKMAGLWFSSIAANYNTAPEVSDIPDQEMDEGESSDIILLDDYVMDIENPDEDIVWTAEQLDTEYLDITINGNREAVATPKDFDWSGTQTVIFTATDLGNDFGEYIESGSDTVVFTVNAVDDAPVITSTPGIEAIVGEEYSYTLEAYDVDNPEVFLSSLIKPDWLSFSEITGLLTGTPSTGDLGGNEVILRASDGLLNTDQDFTIDVGLSDALNDLESAGIHLYPVPAGSYLVIETGDLTETSQIEIISLTGIVLQTIMLNQNQTTYTINTDNMQNGIYYLHLVNKATNYIGKFCVIK